MKLTKKQRQKLTYLLKTLGRDANSLGFAVEMEMSEITVRRHAERTIVSWDTLIEWLQKENVNLGVEFPEGLKGDQA